MRRLLFGDRRMRVRDEGESKKAPVVMIHGAGASSVVWMDMVRRLAPRRRAIAPDLPGHGQSDPWHDVSLDLYRDAVGTMCAHLKLDKVVLVGHSMGGAIALRCALAWPERVAALVLVCTGARLRVAAEVFTALANDYAHAPEWIARVAFSPSTPRELVERWTAVMMTAEQAVTIADFRACDGFDARDRLRGLQIPTLAIAGADDLLTPPKLALEIASILPNARASVLQHTGHMAFLERPDDFHAVLDPFLGEVP